MFFRWGLFLAIVAALGLGGYLYYRLDDEIRRQMEHRLAGHYRHLAVHVGGARFDNERGIAIYDLSVLEPQRGNTPQPLLSVDELFLAGQMRVEDLVSGHPLVDRVVIRRPRLRAVMQPDGRWNVATLLPLPKFSDASPVLAIEDATLILEEAGRRSGEGLTVRGIDLTLTPVPADPTVVVANRRLHVRGTVTGLTAKALKFEGEIGTGDGSLDLTVDVNDLEISPELLASVPGLRANAMAEVEISGRADAALRVTRAAGTNAAIDWSADVTIDRGQLIHPALPHPLTDVAVTLSADPHRLKVVRFTGKCGTAKLMLACERRGWVAAAPIALAAKVVDLPLDARFEALMPVKLARISQRFKPSGKVDVEVRAQFDGLHWRPHFTADCHGITLTDAVRFPYLLEQATGKVEYTPIGPEGADHLHLSLMAVGGGRPVKIEAQLSHLTAGAGPNPVTNSQSAVGNPQSPAPHPVGWVEISGTDIPIHDQLLAAMPEKGCRLVQSLRAQGVFDFRWRAEWTDPLQLLADKSQEIMLKDCAIQFEKFPYPLRHVRGMLTERNGHWKLHDVEGRGGNDSTVVICSGESTPVGSGCRIDLIFQGQNVPLDDNLRQALPARAQKAWTELRPQGRIDFAARVVNETGQTAPTLAVTLRPRERSVSIEPQTFPYRLEQLEGEATYQGGRVDLKGISAHHDRVHYSAGSGSWEPTADGGWQFALNAFNADRFTSHRDLIVALPPRLQKILERLQPSGTFGIYDSTLQLTKDANLGRIAAAWDVSLDCHQAALQGGVPLENISGGIRLVGKDDGQSSFTTGELAIDSLTWKDIQLTNVRGPLWVDRSFCLIGQPASQKQGQPLRRVTADAYGGSLAGDMRLEHDGNPRYQLDIALGGADLGRFANERHGGQTDLSGSVAGRLTLSGTGRSTHALNGAGELHIVDANIYELPLLVALLKVLRNRTPNSTAFDRCDMQFAIQGEHVHFQQLNLLGDAVSLYGRGETNFDRQLNLMFYSLVGPADLPIPLWKTIAGKVSQQGLQLKVTGTWDKPETQREVLPSVNQVLQEIQTGIQAGTATVAPPMATRAESAPVNR